MANLSFFKPAFDDLATDNYIGDPDGQFAYAYLRVSDSDQAEDGRSGLSRQIEHIHEVACKHGYKISWELVFADDYTGFEFEGRPALSKLRREYKSSHRKANAIVIEHLDRLSRNADWHQGFLLDEMHRHGIEAVFWKTFSSRIERAVMGAIAQDGMEQAKERMKAGTIKKAQSGRITAKRAALGYRLVDPSGNEKTMEARKLTHYAIDEERAVAIRFIYEAIAYNGMSCYELRKALDERGKTDPRFCPPHTFSWNERSLVKLIHNPLYKGEYIANRYYKEKVLEFDEHGLSKTVIKERQRPESEWVRVAVPAIVDETTWDLANRNLYRNKGFARRNKKYEYMLTALIRCDTCGRHYHGHTENKPKHIRRYYCATLFTMLAVRERRPCGQGSIRCDVLEGAVWEVITQKLLDPYAMLEAIDEKYSNDRVAGIREQIVFLERQLAAKPDEERKLYQAYLAEAFTAEEYAAERQRIIRERDVLTAELQTLQSQIMTTEELAEKKRKTLELVQYAREIFDVHDAPISFKTQVIRLLVDVVLLNVKEGWFGLKGTMGAGIYSLPKTPKTPVAGPSGL